MQKKLGMGSFWNNIKEVTFYQNLTSQDICWKKAHFGEIYDTLIYFRIIGLYMI
jgi:hypothetical protein